jgi:diadenosine tetraphosphate (Ap4A) HIT family hydrolase
VVEGCKSCELISHRDAGDAPIWDSILRTAHWDVVHAYDSELLGWLVLACRQHRDSIADLTEAEAAELGGLVRAVSIALGDTLHCEKTYVAQFAEHPLHRHVHVHVVARTDAVPVDRRGPAVFAMLGADDVRRVSASAMNELALVLRSHRALASYSFVD